MILLQLLFYLLIAYCCYIRVRQSIDLSFSKLYFKCFSFMMYLALRSSLKAINKIAQQRGSRTLYVLNRLDSLYPNIPHVNIIFTLHLSELFFWNWSGIISSQIDSASAYDKPAHHTRTVREEHDLLQRYLRFHNDLSSKHAHASEKSSL